MTNAKKIGAVCLMLFGLSACSNMNNQEQRTLSGGALGAVGGAVVGALTAAARALVKRREAVNRASNR